MKSNWIVDYSDLLMSEYGWAREYAIWQLPFTAGIKYIASISTRLTGKDVLQENLQARRLDRLAELQTKLEASK